MRAGGNSDLELRLFGPIAAERNGEALTLPASRKTRAILGFLVLSPRPVSRQRLCDLFFDIPDDPRAALRWSLAKLRPVLDQPGVTRLVAERDMLRVEPARARIDALQVLALAGRNPGGLEPRVIDEALDQICGPLLEDADLPDRHEYSAWLAGQREEAARIEAALIAARICQLDGQASAQIPYLQRWVGADPFGEAAHAHLIAALTAAGRRDQAHEAAARAERALKEAGLRAGPGLRAPLRARTVPPAKPGHPAAANAAAKPVVAMLPFQDLSAAPLPRHVAAGLFDGLTHALSRFGTLIVVSSASAARFGDRPEDPAAIADALGADILVGGSLMAAPDGRLRLRWRAVEGETGRTLTLGDLEGALDDLWDLQEEAARRVAVQVEPRAVAEAAFARLARPTGSPAAYDLYLQGIFAGFSQHGSDFATALALFENAIALDPAFHPALAISPWAAAFSNQVRTPEEMARYAAMSRDALRLGRDDARTQATAGTALYYMAHDFAAAKAAIERAIALNPNEYTAWICGGWMRAMTGEADAAHAMFDRAERLNPLAYGANGLMSGRAMADFMVGRMKEAERFIELALAGDDSHPSAIMTGVATAAALCRADALGVRKAAFLKLYPEGLDALAVRALPFENEACRQRYFEAVAAGLA